MKLRLAALASVFALSTLGWAQHRADQQHLSDPNSFSMILMGDPQNYVKVSFYQPIFELCTVWAADNIDNLNIKAVLFTGDMVNRNEHFDPTSTSEDQSSKQMYEWASHCLKRLDNKVPYMISGGNHDHGFTRGDEGFTHMPEYYTYERNSKFADCLVSAYPNRSGVASLENSAYEFHDKNWGDLLVISLEWATRDEVVEWAKKLCESEKYKNHKVILLVHSFLRGGKEAKRTCLANQNYKIQNANHGQELWDKLVYPCSNIRMVLCGHTGKHSKSPNTQADYIGNTAYRMDKNNAGKSVHQMMFNNQFLGGHNGGDGWVRILEFLPDGKTVKASTYSPLFGISPMTKQYAHRTGKCDQFDMTIE